MWVESISNAKIKEQNAKLWIRQKRRNKKLWRDGKMVSNRQQRLILERICKHASILADTVFRYT
jgi:hypothetical protein